VIPTVHGCIHFFHGCYMDEYTSFIVFVQMNTFFSWLLCGFDNALRRQLQLLSTIDATIAILTTYVRFFVVAIPIKELP